MSIRPLKSKPFSEIKNLELSYLDNSLEFLNTSYSTSESFNFNLYNALKNINDLTVNNYSYFFLGKKDLYTNWLKANIKENETNGYITPITFILEGKPAFLYFNQQNISLTPDHKLTWDTDFTLYSVETVLAQGIDPAIQQNYLFIIEYIEGTNKCYIKHINGKTDYYLINRKWDYRLNQYTGGPCDDLWFSSQKDLAEVFGQFNFIKTGDTFLFYLACTDDYKVQRQDGTYMWVSAKYNLEYEASENNYKLKVPQTSPENLLYYIDPQYIGQIVQLDSYNGRLRSLGPDSMNDTKLTLVSNPDLAPLVNYNGKNYNVISTITDKFTDLTDYINTSWISYKDRNFANVNVEKSAYNLESQCLFHLQYNNIDDKFSTTLNIIPLKNHLSPKNFAIRGDYLNTGTNNDPNVDFREYTSLETGTNQEFGNSTVTLNYIFYDIEYIINPGEDLAFSIGANEDNDRGVALYPFQKLNINDTKFVKNGSFGSTNPFLSDKVKKLQTNSVFSNNGRYLHTWLYQSKSNPYGIWLDRYYYPNIISKQDALKGKVNFDPASFNDIIDKDYIQSDELFYSYIQDAPYFDKQSDLMFEQNGQYVYSRVGKDQVNAIISNISDAKEYELSSYSSNEEVVTINNLNIKNSGILDLNFDIYLDSDKVYGLDLFANSSTNGLSISNLNDVTPFLYTFDNYYDSNNNLSNAIVTLHNTNFDIIKQLNIQHLYKNNEEILGLALNIPYEDFAIIGSEYVYIVSYDLILKERIKLVNENEVLKKVNIINNKLFYLIDKQYKFNLPDNQTDIFRHFYVLDLDRTTDEVSELMAYIPGTSRLVYKVTDLTQNKLYPVYYSSSAGENDNNIVFDHIDLNGKQVYRTQNSDIAPLPEGLLESTYVYLLDDTGFSKEQNYYCPDLRVAESLLTVTSQGINSIFIDKDDTAYAFPYIQVTKQNIEDGLFGIRERVPDALYQIENIDLNDYKQRVIDLPDANIIFTSYNRIFDISVNDLNQFACLKYQSNKTSDSKKLELQLFDRAKRPQRSIIVGDLYDNAFGLDALKIYNKGNLENDFVLFTSKYDKEFEVTNYYVLIVDQNYQSSEHQLTFEVSPDLTSCTNYSQIITTRDINVLNFSLNLPKSSLINDKFVYSFALDEIIAGWYNFRVIIDLNNGVFEVYENEQLLPIKRKITINPNVYNLKNVFNYPFILGTASYKNAVTLNDFLGFKDEKSFNAVNFRIKNFLLYSKLLSEDERQALLLSFSDLEPLTITLPGGQRNNFEEIIRYFKYNPPANMSNTIRINIKNSGITKLSDQQNLSLDILRKINEELAVPLNIKEIKFI